MATNDYQRVSFGESDTRRDEMHSTIENWVKDLVDQTEQAGASDEFQEWLDVQQRFHDYSHRNTLLIKLQCPEATRVAGYRTWQTEFDRHVKEGESAIWIWAPIITSKCPECGNAPSYHGNNDCEYDETPPDEWSDGLVGFRPTSVFDVSQTEGEPLPELETAATGDASDLLPTLLKTASELGVDANIVPQSEWSHGDVEGICTYGEPGDTKSTVEIRSRTSDAAVAVTLVHEYAHALLHDGGDADERAKRELEAEAVAYVVGRHFGLDTSSSAFYLAAWADDEPETVMDRFERISRTAADIIDAVEDTESE